MCNIRNSRKHPMNSVILLTKFKNNRFLDLNCANAPQKLTVDLDFIKFALNEAINSHLEESFNSV